MIVPIDGDYAPSDLDYPVQECAFDGELWICNIDTTYYYFEYEDYFEEWEYLELAEDYQQAWSPEMESWFSAIWRENLSEMTITMDGDLTLSDLENLDFSECWFDEEQWICNIDIASDPYLGYYYQLWSYITDAWSPDDEREDLSHVDAIISSVNSNKESSRFTQDLSMERSRSPSSAYDSNKISPRYQEKHPTPIENSSFPLLPEPLATVSLLSLICISFPLFCWLCYRCCFRKGAAKIQRSELSEVLLSSLDVVNAHNERTFSIVIV